MKSVVLISTPWPLYSRPSIQLGTLKAYLKSQFPDIQIKALHLYLKIAENIGYKLYHELSEKTWPAESIYAAMLFPEQADKIKKVFYREARGSKILQKTNFDDLVLKVKNISDHMIKVVDWNKFSLAGFSICLCQLTSSLYFIKSIKHRFPDLRIVTGGSIFTGHTISQLIETFSEIDYVINGEGELPLTGLINHLIKSGDRDQTPSIPGVISRNRLNISGDISFNQMKNLEPLPPPDYDEYFDMLKRFRPEKKFFPTLCAEISRGCWWNSTKKPSGKKGCAFCNLNLQWEGYRKKDISQTISEIDYLTEKHKILSVAFMDNLLPLKENKEIFLRLKKLGKDLSLFAELRATTPYNTLKSMRSAGVEEVQIGIEALSTNLLKKFNKGTTGIQNLEIMKNCEELGISNMSNLILCFPGSDTDDVNQTLNALEYALPFRPLRVVEFWLGLGSPVWDNQHAFGLKNSFNHPNYSALFPPHIVQSIDFMIQSFTGKREYQKKLWMPVKKKVKEWKSRYDKTHKDGSCLPVISFRDGGDFLIIRHKRPGADPMTHRVTGVYKDIYVFCRKNRSIERITSEFSHTPKDKILSFLKTMQAKKLIYQEKNRYLSLASKIQSK